MLYQRWKEGWIRKKYGENKNLIKNKNPKKSNKVKWSTKITYLSYVK